MLQSKIKVYKSENDTGICEDNGSDHIRNPHRRAVILTTEGKKVFKWTKKLMAMTIPLANDFKRSSC